MKDSSLFERFATSADESLPPLSGSDLVQALAPTSPALSLSDLPLADPDEALVGAVLGSFRIVRKLAHGGMGTVYLAQQAAIGSQVAVKFMHPHLAEDPRLVARFYAEARAVNLIGHENVVSIFDVGLLPPSRHYLVMEYLEGRPLSALPMPLPPRTWVPILVQVCEALAAAHRHEIVHRDLKPENIFLIRRGGTEHFVKLLDFGVARLGPAASRGGSSPTSTGLILGTPEYMAPEQSLSARVDGRSDLYSLGVIAFQLATGRLPFQGGANEMLAAHRDKAPPNPRDLSPDLSETLAEVILCALAKRPEDRYQTAESFKVALLDAVGDRRASLVARQREVELEAQFKDAAGKELGRLRCIQLSRGGLFACTPGPLPPLFSRLTLSLPLDGEERTCAADVVRHVRPAEAGAWGMPPGFGVQFADATPAFKESISRLLQGLPRAATRDLPDDARAAVVLSDLASREWTDPYAFLATERDASMADVRLRGREERRRLEALRELPLSTAQRDKLARCLDRLAWATSILGQPVKRAWYDAGLGNFVGVARCITGGVSMAELEGLRARFLAERRGAEARATVLAVTARSFEAQGKDEQALEQYERALVADPLNLDLQKSYSALKRRGGEGRRRDTLPPGGARRLGA